jgi:hypothetical protein
VPFSQTIRPLVIAPAAALAVLGCYMVLIKNIGPYLLIMLLITAPFVYAAEVVFVVPLLWLLPALRRPSFVVGAVWGAAATLGFVSVLAIAAWHSRQPAWIAAPYRGFVPWTLRQWEDVGLTCLPGVASGLLFAHLTRKN